jgi:hypothetical protein
VASLAANPQTFIFRIRTQSCGFDHVRAVGSQVTNQLAIDIQHMQDIVQPISDDQAFLSTNGVEADVERLEGLAVCLVDGVWLTVAMVKDLDLCLAVL